MAAADRRRDEQHRLLLHQLVQLCRLIQQQHLQRPEEQMAAVVAHIKQVCGGRGGDAAVSKRAWGLYQKEGWGGG